VVACDQHYPQGVFFGLKKMENMMIEVKNGELIVSSLVVAKSCKRAHKSVLASLDKFEGRHGILPTFRINELVGGRKDKVYYLTERQFLIAMPFIGGTKSEEGQVRLVDEFMRLRNKLSVSEKTLEQQRKELLLDAPDEWVRLFEPPFYMAIMNLHHQTFTTNAKTPIYCANITWRMVYAPIVPHELLRELKSKQRSEKLHQWFKQGGRLKLAKQIEKVIMIAEMCQDRAEFEEKCGILLFKRPLQARLN